MSDREKVTFLYGTSVLSYEKVDTLKIDRLAAYTQAVVYDEKTKKEFFIYDDPGDTEVDLENSDCLRKNAEYIRKKSNY